MCDAQFQPKLRSRVIPESNRSEAKDGRRPRGQTEGAEKDDVIQMGEQAGREQGRRRAREDWLGEIFISRGRKDESGETTAGRATGCGRDRGRIHQSNALINESVKQPSLRCLSLRQ